MDEPDVIKRKPVTAYSPPRFKWLVELHLLSTAGTVTIGYHVIVTADSVESAFTEAEHEYAYSIASSDSPPELNYFLFEYSDLAEIIPDYFWHAGEGSEAIEVRKLEEVT